MIAGLSDGLTRIRNAISRERPYALLKSSKALENVLESLLKLGLIWSYRRLKYETFVSLRYLKKGGSKITDVKMLSKPSHKRYVTVKELSNMSFWGGVFILSTSSGWLTGFDCLKLGKGGLLVCYVRSR